MFFLIFIFQSCGGGSNSVTDDTGATQSESDSDIITSNKLVGIYAASYSYDDGTSCYSGFCSETDLSQTSTIFFSNNYKFVRCLKDDQTSYSVSSYGSSYDPTTTYECYYGSYSISENESDLNVTLNVERPSSAENDTEEFTVYSVGDQVEDIAMFSSNILDIDLSLPAYTRVAINESLGYNSTLDVFGATIDNLSVHYDMTTLNIEEGPWEPTLSNTAKVFVSYEDIVFSLREDESFVACFLDDDAGYYGFAGTWNIGTGSPYGSYNISIIPERTSFDILQQSNESLIEQPIQNTTVYYSFTGVQLGHLAGASMEITISSTESLEYEFDTDYIFGHDSNLIGLEDEHTNCLNALNESFSAITSPNSGMDADGDGYFSEYEDCDDSNAGINPAAVEICDQIDNNCNKVIDAGLDVDECNLYLSEGS